MCVCGRSEQISITGFNANRRRRPPSGLRRQPFVIIVATMLALHLTGKHDVLCERISKRGLPNIEVTTAWSFKDCTDIAESSCGNIELSCHAGSWCQFEAGAHFQHDIFSAVESVSAASHQICCRLCRRHAAMSAFIGHSDGCQAFTYHLDTSDCMLYDSLPDVKTRDDLVTSGVPFLL